MQLLAGAVFLLWSFLVLRLMVGAPQPSPRLRPIAFAAAAFYLGAPVFFVRFL